jgi:EmrB/QacA subfamily drug resistance transporter
MSAAIAHPAPSVAVGSQARAALAAAVLGFFVVTLDTVVVNVALPAIRADLGGGITGLQWLVDGYTLMFAALLLSSGALTDRIGARRAYAGGIVVFVLASAACAVAPGLTVLVAARFLQGSAAAVMMPASMALIRQAYPDAGARGRALGVWAMGGAVASSAGPALGGALELIDWRLIFLINVPVGAVALGLLAGLRPSPRRDVPLDRVGQVTAVLALGGLTYAAIGAGAAGVTDPLVLAAAAVTVVALAAFIAGQTRGAHPMVPPDLVRARGVAVLLAVGFAFMVGYYGLPFVLSLYLQQGRGLSALATGTVFVPMMLIGAVITPFSARIAERLGRRAVITTGLLTIALDLVALGLLAGVASPRQLAVLMIPVGAAAPLVIPPAIGALLDSVPGDRSGMASGLFNTSRQVGGALGVAVFGGLLADPATIGSGVRLSLLVAAAVLAVATAAAATLPHPSREETHPL